MAMFDREATLDDVREDARELLQGAIDVHVHAAPDPYAERRLPSDVLVERAVECERLVEPDRSDRDITVRTPRDCLRQYGSGHL